MATQDEQRCVFIADKVAETFAETRFQTHALRRNHGAELCEMAAEEVYSSVWLSDFNNIYKRNIHFWIFERLQPASACGC